MLAVLIYNSINPNASKINDIVSISSKLFACDTVFNLKLEDFRMLPFNVSVRNPVCNPDKPIVKYVRKSIYKSVSTGSVLPGKPISDSNVSLNKLISDSSVRPSKLIHGSNVRLSKPFTSSIVRPDRLISGSNIRSVKPISVSFVFVLVNKLVVVMLVQVKPLVLLLFRKVNPYMLVMFVQENLLVLVMFAK